MNPIQVWHSAGDRRPSLLHRLHAERLLAEVGAFTLRARVAVEKSVEAARRADVASVIAAVSAERNPEDADAQGAAEEAAAAAAREAARAQALVQVVSGLSASTGGVLRLMASGGSPGFAGGDAEAAAALAHAAGLAASSSDASQLFAAAAAAAAEGGEGGGGALVRLPPVDGGAGEPMSVLEAACRSLLFRLLLLGQQAPQPGGGGGRATLSLLQQQQPAPSPPLRLDLSPLVVPFFDAAAAAGAGAPEQLRAEVLAAASFEGVPGAGRGTAVLCGVYAADAPAPAAAASAPLDVVLAIYPPATSSATPTLPSLVRSIRASLPGWLVASQDGQQGGGSGGLAAQVLDLGDGAVLVLAAPRSGGGVGSAFLAVVDTSDEDGPPARLIAGAPLAGDDEDLEVEAPPPQGLGATAAAGHSPIAPPMDLAAAAARAAVAIHEHPLEQCAVDGNVCNVCRKRGLVESWRCVSVGLRCH